MYNTVSYKKWVSAQKDTLRFHNKTKLKNQDRET